MYCVVKDCGSIWNPTSNVIFHSFPKNPEKRQKWLSSIPLKRKFYESAKICSLHFKPEDYDPSRPSKRLLICAVPVYSVQLCSRGDSVKACTTPFKCLVSPNVKMQTETGTCSTLSEKECSYLEKEIHITHSENIPCTTPFKCLVSPNVNLQTKTGTCSTLSEKECSYLEKELHNTHSENIVDSENEPPAKRRRLKDFNVQCNIKTLREKSLAKQKKVLQQKVARNEQKIKDLKSLVNIVRNYTSQSEIENILQGNFAEICKYFKKRS